MLVFRRNTACGSRFRSHGQVAHYQTTTQIIFTKDFSPPRAISKLHRSVYAGIRQHIPMFLSLQMVRLGNRSVPNSCLVLVRRLAMLQVLPKQETAKHSDILDFISGSHGASQKPCRCCTIRSLYKACLLFPTSIFSPEAGNLSSTTKSSQNRA